MIDSFANPFVIDSMERDNLDIKIFRRIVPRRNFNPFFRAKFVRIFNGSNFNRWEIFELSDREDEVEGVSKRDDWHVVEVGLIDDDDDGDGEAKEDLHEFSCDPSTSLEDWQKFLECVKNPFENRCKWRYFRVNKNWRLCLLASERKYIEKRKFFFAGKFSIFFHLFHLKLNHQKTNRAKFSCKVDVSEFTNWLIYFSNNQDNPTLT